MPLTLLCAPMDDGDASLRVLGRDPGVANARVSCMKGQRGARSMFQT